MFAQNPSVRSAPISALAVLAVALCLRTAAITAPESVPPLEKEQEHTPALEAMRDGATIDINTANADALQLLPRVGPVLAARIIEGRPYDSVDALVRVRGVGPATLERLRPLVSAKTAP